MRRSHIVAVVLCLLASPVLAVDVRGRVDFVAPNGIYPMIRAAVRLCRVQTGQCTFDYFTGNDGMYYFQNLAPGVHAIIVNGIERWRVDIPPWAGFDIAPTRGN